MSLPAFILLLAAAGAVPTAARDAAFWRHLAESGYTVPEGTSPAALLVETSAFLGSPDATLRDGVAYAVAAEWIVRKKLVEPADLRPLLDLWAANLKRGIGETGNDGVLLRSFSALDLSLLAARDLQTPYLAPAELKGLLDAALAYLAAERDLRGYEPGKGWLHATAHTADLLKFLARNPRLPREEAARILPAIGVKLRDAGQVFAWGEDERLASAVLAVLKREDADPAVLDAWLAQLTGAASGLWEAPALDVKQFAAVQNGKHVLSRLHVLLSVVPEPTPAVVQARGRVLHALEQLP